MFHMSVPFIMICAAGHQGAVTALVRVGPNVFSSSGDTTVRVWEASTGQPLVVLKGHVGWVSSLLQVGDDVWSAAADRRVHVWDTNVCLFNMTGFSIASILLYMYISLLWYRLRLY